MRELLKVTSDSLERFLTRWYGPPDRPPAPVHDAAVSMPSALRHWYEVTGRWSVPVVHHNLLLPPGELEMLDGKLLFWVENQGCWEWATEAAGDDPPVYDREPSEDPTPWLLTSKSLATFLVHVAVFEALVGVPHHAMTAHPIPQDQVDTLLQGLTPLRGVTWRWPSLGYGLYAGDGILADVGPSGQTVADPARFRVDPGQSDCALSLAALTPQLLERRMQLAPSGTRWHVSGR
jgi:hypothetical protein